MGAGAPRHREPGSAVLLPGLRSSGVTCEAGEAGGGDAVGDRDRLHRAEAQTYDAVVTAIGTSYHVITAQDARGFFRAVGYNV